MNEFDIIQKYFAPLSEKEKGALGLSDDAAVITVPQGSELVVTKDAIVEGVHFTGKEPPSLIASKLLRVNLSDLAAMGATPYAYFLALMLPQRVDGKWLESFAAGLQSDQKNFGITLMGGDTTHTYGALSLSLTALGFVPKGQALKRNGAKAGDDVYVSGTIGDAALGLQVAKGNLQDDYLLERYQLPTPRVELAEGLRGIATSCIDVSDGLMQDLGHIAECSGVAAIIEWEKIPLSDAAKKILPQIKNIYEIIVAGGDDYELLFTAPASARKKLQELARKTGVGITLMGSIKEGNGVKMIDKSGKDIYLSSTGYDHFKKNT